MRVTYRFGAVKLSHKVLTVCQCCDREYTHNLQESVYDNGFHNMSKTKSNWYEWAEVEAERISKEGAICTTCKRAGAKPIPGWTMPPFAPVRPQKPQKPIAKLYLSPSTNILWLSSEGEYLKNLTCPKTGEPLIQLPYDPKNPSPSEKKPFPAGWVENVQPLYAFALIQYQAEMKQYKKDIAAYKLIKQQRQEAFSNSSLSLAASV